MLRELLERAGSSKFPSTFLNSKNCPWLLEPGGLDRPCRAERAAAAAAVMLEVEDSTVAVALQVWIFGKLPGSTVTHLFLA